MDDRTTAVVAPSGLFQGSNTASADNELSRQLQQSAVERAAASLDMHPRSDRRGHGGSRLRGQQCGPGDRPAQHRGRRPDSLYEHTNFRIVAGTKGSLDRRVDIRSLWFVLLRADVPIEHELSRLCEHQQRAAGHDECRRHTGLHCRRQELRALRHIQDGRGHARRPPIHLDPGDGVRQQHRAGRACRCDRRSGQVWSQVPLVAERTRRQRGREHRKETETFAPDGAELSGNLAGFSGALVPIDVHYDVNEAFAELRAPLAHDLPGVHDLTTDVGYRYSNYNTAGVTNTYKFEVQYAPIEDARVRFSFDRAVRAPN